MSEYFIKAKEIKNKEKTQFSKGGDPYCRGGMGSGPNVCGAGSCWQKLSACFLFIPHWNVERERNQDEGYVLQSRLKKGTHRMPILPPCVEAISYSSFENKTHVMSAHSDSLFLVSL